MRRLLVVVALVLAADSTAAAQGWGTTLLDPGVSLPVLVKGVKATYTPEAKAAQLQGWIDLQVVVRPDGKVGDVKVLRSCVGRIGARREPNGDPFRCTRADERVQAANNANRIDPTVGLDQQSAKAAEQWVFRPGMKDGKPVAVRIVIRMNFDLRDKPSSD